MPLPTKPSPMPHVLASLDQPQAPRANRRAGLQRSRPQRGGEMLFRQYSHLKLMYCLQRSRLGKRKFE